MAILNEHEQPLIVILKQARIRTKNKNLSEQVVEINKKRKRKKKKKKKKISFQMEVPNYFPLPYFLTSLLILIVIIFPSLINCFFIDEKQSPQTHEWSYTDQVNWRRENKQCGLKSQSPIDIQRRYVIPSNHLKLHFYNYNQNTKFKIQNAHHTIKLNPIDLNSFGNGNDNQFGIKLTPENQNQNHQNDDQSSGGSIDKAPLVPDLMAVEDDVEPEYEAKTPVNNNNNNSPVINKHKQHHTHNQGQNNNNNNREQTRIGTDHQYGSSSSADQHSKSHQQQQQQQQNQGLDSNSIGMIDENINVEDVAQSGTSSSTASLAYNGAPTIKLDWLDDGNNEYKLHDIHFHWGERRDNGSEHAIDGRRAAMEMHLVHIKHGLDNAKIGYTSDSITVIAVLIESYRKSNADFNPIVNALTRINMTSQTQEIEYKSINDLLPNILTSFYTYSGSLTTPPCYQVVNWIVMSDRLYLNAKQIEMFRNLYPPSNGEVEGQEHELSSSSETTPIMPNIRSIQPINNRTILASFSPLSRLEQIQVANSPYNAAISNHLSEIHLTSLICISLIWSSLIYSVAINNEKLLIFS